MYLGGGSKTLSIEDNVSVIRNIEIFIIELGKQIVHPVPNYLINDT